jgi:hypothetical protein
MSLSSIDAYILREIVEPRVMWLQKRFNTTSYLIAAVFLASSAAVAGIGFTNQLRALPAPWQPEGMTGSWFFGALTIFPLILSGFDLLRHRMFCRNPNTLPPRRTSTETRAFVVVILLPFSIGLSTLAAYSNLPLPSLTYYSPIFVFLFSIGDYAGACPPRPPQQKKKRESQRFAHQQPF